MFQTLSCYCRATSRALNTSHIHAYLRYNYFVDIMRVDKLNTYSVLTHLFTYFLCESTVDFGISSILFTEQLHCV